MFFAGVVISEAGIIYQSNFAFGPHYHPESSYAVRPALIRSHTVPYLGLSPTLNNHGSDFNSAFFTSPVVLNPALTSHAALAPPSLYPAPISHGAILPALPTDLSTTALSSVSIGSSLTRTYTSPPKVQNFASINHGVIGHTHTSSHTAQNPTMIGNHKINIQEMPEQSVSYSLSENDYHYLKRHKTKGQDSPYNPFPGLDTAKPSEKHHNPHSHHANDQDAVSQPSESHNVVSEDYQGYNEPSLINVNEPVVTKDIYFHVPPPDFEEPPPVPISLPLPKKTYNIVFIKVPAQEQQNYAYLQQLLQSRQSQIQDKTLIYVLSKKEKLPTQVVLAPHQVSSPEVFFVNYKNKPQDITEISNELVEESLHENIYPALERKRRLGDSQSDR